MKNLRLNIMLNRVVNPSCGQAGHNLNRGFGLIELMIAMVIGLITLAALGFVFVNAKDVFSIQQGSARIQENGRFAMEIMSRDIRHAGYFGCLEGKDLKRYQEDGGSSVVSTISQTDPLVTSFAAVEGFNNGATNETWLPSNSALPAGADMDKNSDGITIRFANPDVSVGLTQNMIVPYDATINIETTGADDWEAGSMVVISSCDAMNVFELDNAPLGGSLNNPGSLSAAYNNDSSIRSLEAIRYFVKKDAGVSTLMREELFPSGAITTSPLIDGIENFQVLYGSDNDGDGVIDIYQNAEEVTNWNVITSVQVGVLANTIQEYGQLDRDADDAPTQYAVLDENLTAGSGSLDDLRTRRTVFSTTIALRQK